MLKSGEAERIAKWGRRAFRWGDSCGVAWMGDWYMFGGDTRKDERVRERHQLKETLEWGYFEACQPPPPPNTIPTPFPSQHLTYWPLPPLLISVLRWLECAH